MEITKGNFLSKMFINEAKPALNRHSGGGGEPAVIEPLSVTENGTYNPPEGVSGFKPVNVDVPGPVLEPLNVTENGTYNPPEGVDGFKPVDVNIESFPNGTGWTQSNVGASRVVKDICYANGLWVASMDGNSGGLWYSNDGKTWQQSNFPTFQTFCDGHGSICHAKGMWVACSNNVVCYSTDGKSWTKNASMNISGTSRCVYRDGTWVLCVGADAIYHSTDGITWTQSSSISDTGVGYLYAFNSMFFICGGSALHYSTDGIEWVKSIDGRIYFMHYANGLFIACGVGGIYYSEDGVAWESSNVTVKLFDGNCCYANGKWVLVANASYNTAGYYATDGKEWISFSSQLCNRVAYANGVWVFGGNPSYLRGFYYSLDGTTLTKCNPSSDVCVTNILNENGIWVAGTRNGLFYSVTWEPST